MKYRLLLIPIFLILLLLAACSGRATEETPATTPEGMQTPETASAAVDEQTVAADSEPIVSTREPEPTATPGPLTRQVTGFVQTTDLAEVTFLGLTAANWINLAISVLIVVLAFVIGSLVTRIFLKWIARRTSPEFSAVFQKYIGPRLMWLIVIPASYFATIRLNFLSPELKELLTDIYFVLLLYMVVLITWTVIDIVYEYYRQRFVAEERGDQLEPVLLLLKRLAQIIVVSLGLTVLLSHFGVNFLPLLAGLGILGLAFSLAAQDTLADAISGFIILLDQPYRIGDRIQIQDENTWGDVIDIGLRTTRIRTLDNRMVIVPNSVISNNQIVNYTFPDPRYRIQTHVHISYGSDIEKIRELIMDTVRQVDGVLPDKPVDSLYVEMGESAMIFRVRWWLESYSDTRNMVDRVNTALQKVFDANGIYLPFPIHTTRLEVDNTSAFNLSQAFQG